MVVFDHTRMTHVVKRGILMHVHKHYGCNRERRCSVIKAWPQAGTHKQNLTCMRSPRTCQWCHPPPSAGPALPRMLGAHGSYCQ